MSKSEPVHIGNVHVCGTLDTGNRKSVEAITIRTACSIGCVETLQVACCFDMLLVCTGLNTHQ